jgi:hypothetical protein
LSALTDGVEDRQSVLLADLNWQVQNGLTYFAKEVRKDLAVARLSDVALYAPAFVAGNLAIQRDVVLTESARNTLERAYGPLFEIDLDSRTRALTMTELVRSLPLDTRYALTVLRPVRELTLDMDDLREALEALTGGRVATIGDGDYALVAGLVGRQPTLLQAEARPFRASADLGGVDVTVRMDSWLPFDTIRRMGFGHVIAARRHALIVERGVSFVSFDEAGRPLRSGYTTGIFARERRFVIRRMLPGGKAG